MSGMVLGSAGYVGASQNNIISRFKERQEIIVINV